MASTVYVFAGKLTYASMSLTGAKLTDELAHGSVTTIEKVNYSLMFSKTAASDDFPCGISTITVTSYTPT